MQGEWEGGVEEEEPEWISSSESQAAVDPDSEESEEPPNLQAIAAVVLQDVREREQYAQIVARAGGIEPGRRPAPEPRARGRAQERERRQLEIARRYREERRQRQEQARAERQRARELVQEYRINIRAAAKRIAREDPVQRRVEEERRRGEEQRSRTPPRDRNQPTRS